MSVSQVRCQSCRGTFIRPGWIASPFKWCGPGTQPRSALALLAAGLTKRRRPDQRLSRIGPPIWMSVIGVVDLKIVRQARVKIWGRSVIAALEKTPRQDAKPQRHLIEPGAMLGRKVKDMLMGRIAEERTPLGASLQGLGAQVDTLPVGDETADLDAPVGIEIIDHPIVALHRGQLLDDVGQMGVQIRTGAGGATMHH